MSTRYGKNYFQKLINSVHRLRETCFVYGENEIQSITISRRFYNDILNIIGSNQLQMIHSLTITMDQSVKGEVKLFILGIEIQEGK